MRWQALGVAERIQQRAGSAIASEAEACRGSDDDAPEPEGILRTVRAEALPRGAAFMRYLSALPSEQVRRTNTCVHCLDAAACQTFLQLPLEHGHQKEIVSRFLMSLMPVVHLLWPHA